ncbi:uncharacterized protein SAPINGB_P003841 [Magnusiomyces paraingens]|uniref:Enolase-phosphatase E1 n=1 Tax=Magnusiomyces paraingens TaxID=2606893 RepID=A0A5E8BTM7_9ASCO|nr:uncharacterized protein SAPINGB_P003841 [Saprochaete ingens]VVT53969.1 unnamed protein product [Saprochaete ingens]
MAAKKINSLLLDIEGTVCPISYVKDVLFPYAKNAAAEKIPPLTQYFPLPDNVKDLDLGASTGTVVSSDDTELLGYLCAFPQAARQSPVSLLGHIDGLIDNDVKDPALKALQGYLWHSGYVSGEVTAPVYPDAVKAIKKYSKELPSGVSIYSSGSVKAQILLFKHTTDDGDLTPYLSDYFDTINAGPKTVKESYETISNLLGVQNDTILFLSDNPKEVEAAVAAGFNSYIVVRPGNAPLPEDAKTKYKVITTLDDII